MAGLGYLLVVAVYAVLAGIAPTPVSDPTPRIPALLFAVIVPGVAAFTLAAGSVLLWRRYGLGAPVFGLAVGSVVAGVVGPDEGLAYILLLGGMGWLALLAVGELLGRALERRRQGESLTADDVTGVVGAFVGLAYTLVFGVMAVWPAWAAATGPSAPGPVEASLTLAFLAGAFCLLLGLPVALALRAGLLSPLIVPILWLANDVGSGWRAYVTYDELAIVMFFLVWPAAMVVIAILALAEYLLRLGWRRVRGPRGTMAVGPDDPSY